MQPVALAAAAAAPSSFSDITAAALLASLAGAPAGRVTLRGTVDNTAAGSVLELKPGTALAEVNRKYPKASADVKQGVEREQKRAKC